MKFKNIKIAILDFNAGQKNEGLRCIIEKVEIFFNANNLPSNLGIFEVRIKQELPKIQDFDIFIGSGGPGNPIYTKQDWEIKAYNWFQELFDFNFNNLNKKYCFLICHSFQLMVQFLGIAKISKRHSTSFGILPIHKTIFGAKEILFSKLPDPFYAVDSRDYQVVEPNIELIDKMNIKTLCLEKIRTHVNFERAIMAVRFTDEIIGTQFHPEADILGMKKYLQSDEKKEIIIETFGKEKYEQMCETILDPNKLKLTEDTILPSFLMNSFQLISQNCD